MSEVTTGTATRRDTSSTTPTPTPPDALSDAVTDPLADPLEKADPTQVALYLTLNNTTHNETELPEVMAAMKQAEHEGLGTRKVLAISDPYASKQADKSLAFDEGTYGDVFGEEAAGRLQWWHGQKGMEQGQVRIGGDVKTLGTSLAEGDVAAEKKVVEDWKTTVMTLGMDAKTADKLVLALFANADGSFRALDSGDGATNELVQFAMAMYRAEQGEIDVRSIVFSGHHWDEDNRPGEGQGIWGEVPGSDHVYDNIDDYFSLMDVAVLQKVFPKAYAQVKSIQLAACNTDSLGMQDKDGNDLTTNQFLKSVFPSLEMTSYWKEVLAPVAKNGAETNGEFLLDAMRIEGNRSDAAAKDSRHNAKGLKRSLLNASGELEEIRMGTKRSSYVGTASGLGKGALKDGLRDTNTDYKARSDLSKYRYQASSMPSLVP